jgi:hypothetical protein
MTLGYRTEDFEKTRLVHMRNATIPIGCACVKDETLRLEALSQHFAEKRSKTTKQKSSRILKPMKRHPSLNLNWIFVQRIKEMNKKWICRMYRSLTSEKNCINILGEHAWQKHFMACSKLEAMAIYVVKSANANDKLPWV